MVKTGIRPDLPSSIIDLALLDGSIQGWRSVIRLRESYSLQRLAERIRKRGSRLAKDRRNETRAILRARDELILRIYASAVPQGWGCGWSDGASFKVESGYHAGIGGIIMDPDGHIIERISRGIGDRDPFEAEMAAVVAVMKSAAERKQSRLVIHTDNKGIVQLWCERRGDERLDDIRLCRERFERFSLRAIPRLHNQAANTLARQAVSLDRR